MRSGNELLRSMIDKKIIGVTYNNENVPVLVLEDGNGVAFNGVVWPIRAADIRKTIEDRKKTIEAHVAELAELSGIAARVPPVDPKTRKRRR